jgi:hypothetical protein
MALEPLSSDFDQQGQKAVRTGRVVQVSVYLKIIRHIVANIMQINNVQSRVAHLAGLCKCSSKSACPAQLYQPAVLLSIKTVLGVTQPFTTQNAGFQRLGTVVCILNFEAHRGRLSIHFLPTFELERCRSHTTFGDLHHPINNLDINTLLHEPPAASRPLLFVRGNEVEPLHE